MYHTTKNTDANDQGGTGQDCIDFTNKNLWDFSHRL